MAGKGERQPLAVEVNTAIGSQPRRQVEGSVGLVGELQTRIDLVVEKGLEKRGRIGCQGGIAGGRGLVSRSIKELAGCLARANEDSL